MPDNDNDRNYINFWPFDSFKDGVRRHREWLRRWLLANEKMRVTMLSVLVAGILVILAAGVWHIVLQDMLKKPFQPANSVQVKNVTVNKQTDNQTDKRANNLPKSANTIGNTTGSIPAGTAVNGVADTAANTPVNPAANTPVNPAANTPTQAGQTTGSAVYSKPGVREALDTALPLYGQVTVTYGMGYSTLYEDFRFHKGIDVLSTKDDVVKAVLAGKVLTVGQSEGEGLTITIKHADGYLTSYSNITSPEVTVGQQVSRGQAIAKVEAETGILHFALQKGQQGLNPLQYLSY